MDVTVRGRNVEVPSHYRRHVTDKLRRIERYDHKVIRVDVELYHEKNRRQSSICQRVEITCKSRGPVIRSEANAADFYTALDAAVTKLQRRLRRAADRRRVHYGLRTPTSLAAATAEANGNGAHPTSSSDAAQATAVMDIGNEPERDDQGSNDRLGVVPLAAQSPSSENGEASGPGRIVREKEHPAIPMTVEQAVFEMELVGHDFYLFQDADSGAPSVVYRRKGYDYGVIMLRSESRLSSLD